MPRTSTKNPRLLSQTHRCHFDLTETRITTQQRLTPHQLAQIRLSHAETKTTPSLPKHYRTTFHATSPCLANRPAHLRHLSRPFRSGRLRTQSKTMSGSHQSRGHLSRRPKNLSVAGLLSLDFLSIPAGPFPPKPASASPDHHPRRPTLRLAAISLSAPTRCPRLPPQPLRQSLLPPCPLLDLLLNTRVSLPVPPMHRIHSVTSWRK